MFSIMLVILLIKIAVHLKPLKVSKFQNELLKSLSYYHVWNPHEILHWISDKNKNLKKIVRTHVLLLQLQNRRFYFIVGCTAKKCSTSTKAITFCSCYKKSCIAPKIEFFENYLVFSILPKKNEKIQHDVIIQVQNGNGVINRVVSCLKCIELACWVLQSSLDLYYYLR